MKVFPIPSAAIWTLIAALILAVPAEVSSDSSCPVVGPEVAIAPTFAPAPASQAAVSIAESPHGYLAVWQDSRDDGSAWEDPQNTDTGVDIYATRLSPTGEVLDKHAIAVSTAEGDQTEPAVAWNGRDYVVVWSDRRETTQHIYAARVRPTGEVIDRQGLLVSGTSGVQAFPRIASDGQGCLIVWQDSRGSSLDIYGCTMTSDAFVSRTYGIITMSGNEETPDVAYLDGSNYFVVWRDSRHASKTNPGDVYGCRVARNGVRVGVDVHISAMTDGSSATGDQQLPRICKSSNGAFVVWEDTRNGSISQIYGTRISSNGSVVDKGGIQISGSSDSLQRPSVGFSGSKFLVIWRNGTNRQIMGARLSTTGQVLDGTPRIISSGTAGSSGTAVAGMQDSFIATWSTLDALASDVVAANVSDNGTVSPAAVIAQGLVEQLDFAVADSGNTYAVVWAELVNGQYDIKGAVVSRTGELLTQTAVNLTNTPGTSTQPSIAWNGNKYMLVWREDGGYGQGNIFGYFLDSQLNVISSSPIIVSVAADDQSKPCVASNGSGFCAVWQDKRNAVSPNYYTDIYGATISSTGSVSALTINQSTNNQFNPKITSNGYSYIAVWEDWSTGMPAVYAARISNSGQLQDASGIKMPQTSYHQTCPSVSFGNGSYMIVWSDYYGIGACRVDYYGDKLDPEGISINVQNRVLKRWPSACWDGEKYHVIWEDYRSSFTGNADLYHTTVDANGAVSTAKENSIASDLNPQLRPVIFFGEGEGLLFYSERYNEANSTCVVSLHSQEAQIVESIADAKNLPMGSLVTLETKVVSGVFDGYFYMQDQNRTSGIRVIANEALEVGDVVSVTGNITVSDGQAQISATEVVLVDTSGPDPKPLGMRGDALGGAALNGDVPGVTGGSGANNIGLLVRTWGKVVSTNTSYFTIEIKPGVQVKIRCGSISKPAVDDMVVVTGISTCEILSGALERTVLVRDQNDIASTQ